ncbi:MULTISPECIES: UDP-N-acetylmuramoyl-tripeptide--D-alanyl-D-alanine ligase [Streptomyces]|nr:MULTISPECIES: UDP-N-acetylmuramoyl-tripeptide--D-alanyl-D-alanine ligase [Streptomyces]MBL0799897.1 UDP-N-acetylmuramoyl-tripeptide--D-alanyl-D-alanine ligase [Streptomyces albidoflavus]MBV1956894.1 UDP-N-acetylmuramoyl-tripeptide--D-alanyl-D-alanine ligase [Streptomyces sp. BV333]MCG5121060.1 UDP-N-acetylmuramoyl-tripeptide--D-alanyl-D-alanine ligase [Streptomyces sp. T7(2022)]UDF08682.1 UDP-N-acetylmuramoyl-tripeptide--D-alanyl-D-alanine ligase [Streptomyces sp. WA1-19]UYX92343.1 UDP-N-ac
MSLTAVAKAVGGRLADVLDPGVQVTEPAVFDSREAVPGSLFVALAGERADGHAFAESAHNKGAVVALVNRPVGVPAIVVDDVLQAFGALAHTLLTGPLAATRVVAITGSAGKTSTKDFVSQVLPGSVVATPQSFNNEIGLPLTVTMADTTTDHLVLEMGARHIGDIRALTLVAPPDISIVTNVGTAHIGEFGGRDNIAEAKGEIVEALAPGGLAVLNADDDYAQPMRERAGGSVVTFGLGEDADVRATDLTADAHGRASFTLVTPEGSAPVRLRFVGGVQVHNSLAAAAVGRGVGLSPEEIAARLSRAMPRSRWRMETVTRADGVTVVNDAYNANPTSVRHALEALASMAGGAEQRSVAVLGQMNELGDDARTAHEAIGRHAAARGIDMIILVGGDEAGWMRDGVRDAGGRATWVPDQEAALGLLHSALRPGDVVLVKASRGVQLQRLAEELLNPAPPAERLTGGSR